MLHPFLSPSLSKPLATMDVYCFHSFNFPIILYSWTPRVCNLFTLTSFTHQVAFNVCGFFGSLIAHFIQFSSVTQSDSLRPHGLQHTRLSCLSLTPRAYQLLSLLNNVTQQGYTTVYLIIHLLENILVASKFWQLSVCVCLTFQFI